MLVYPALRKRNGYYTRKIYSKLSYDELTQFKYKGINFGHIFRYYFYCDIHTNAKSSILVSYNGNFYYIKDQEDKKILEKIFNLIIKMPMGYYEYLELKNNL